MVKTINDRTDYEQFLAEFGFTEAFVQTITHLGKRYYLPMQDLEIRKSTIQGVGLFAKLRFKPGEIIAPALLRGLKTEAGRYTNHAARPNARMVVHDQNNVDLVATRVIEDDEIVVDYRHVLRARGLHPNG